MSNGGEVQGSGPSYGLLAIGVLLLVIPIGVTIAYPESIDDVGFYLRIVASLGVRPSTGTVGDAYDNAMAESFFATLETELLWRTTFRSHAQARMAIFEFIEGFYNPRRRHSALGDISPIQYERRQRSISTTEVETDVAMQIATRSAQPLGSRQATPTSSHLTTTTTTQTPSG